MKKSAVLALLLFSATALFAGPDRLEDGRYLYEFKIKNTAGKTLREALVMIRFSDGTKVGFMPTAASPVASAIVGNILTPRDTICVSSEGYLTRTLVLDEKSDGRVTVVLEPDAAQASAEEKAAPSKKEKRRRK